MELLQSRILLRPENFHEALRRCAAFGFREVRRYGSLEDPHGVVYALAGSMLEISDQAGAAPFGVTLWLRVPDVAAARRVLHDEGYDGAIGEACLQPWGLWECEVELFDGVAVLLVEVPATHRLHWGG